jgi:hypothetical protein
MNSLSTSSEISASAGCLDAIAHPASAGVVIAMMEDTR